MKGIRNTILFIGLSLSSLAQADVIGFKGDISYWSFDGKANMDTSLHSDQDLDTQGTVQLSVAVEHPIPLIPNVKLRYANLDSETKAETLGQANYEINLDQTDLILYYEILDNIVSADIGLGASNLDGDIKNLLGQKSDIEETLPIIYVSGEVKLPFTGLSAKAEVTYSDFDDKRMTDAQAELKYDFVDNLLVDFGIKGGYRILNIDLDDQEQKFEFKGPYVGLDVHF